MSKYSKEVKRQREAAQRAKTGTHHSKVPGCLQGTLMVQNSTQPGRVIPNPSFKFPSTLKI
jgi:hypothetical protein